MTINNIQHFLLTNERAIESIPSIESRLSIIETDFNTEDYYELFPAPEPLIIAEPAPDLGGGTERTWSQTDHLELFDDGEFSQQDHDELFADGGATAGSYSEADYTEIYYPDADI